MNAPVNAPENQAPPRPRTPGDPRSALVAQVVLAALAGYVISQSFGLGLWQSFGPGAGFFPLVLGAALLVLSVAWFVQSRAWAAPAGTSGGVDRYHLVTVVGSLVVLGVLLQPLGFQLAMFCFLLCHLKLFHLRRGGGSGWITALAVSAAGSIGTFVLFVAGLGVQLPAASIPFLAALGL